MSDPTDARPPIDDTPDHDAVNDAVNGDGTVNDAVNGDGTVNDAVNDPTQPPESEVVGATPPGYDWPTHGGYLGCLVGSIAACLVTGFFGADLFSYLYIARRWPFPIFALLTLVLFVALVVGLGRLGWQLGKRFYRYYPQPRPTWGESDEAQAEAARTREAVRKQGALNDADAKAAGEPAMRSTADSEDDKSAGQVLVESRQRQDDSGDGSREAADQAENADHEPQHP